MLVHNHPESLKFMDCSLRRLVQNCFSPKFDSQRKKYRWTAWVRYEPWFIPFYIVVTLLVHTWCRWALGQRQIRERTLLWARRHTTESVWYKAALVQCWMRRIRISREYFGDSDSYNPMGGEWDTWFAPYIRTSRVSLQVRIWNCTPVLILLRLVNTVMHCVTTFLSAVDHI